MKQENSRNEFSRVFNLDLIEKKATEKYIEADHEECKMLAKRFSIVEVTKLRAKCILKRRKQKDVGDFLLKVKMDAKVVQRCVLTLGNVPESIDEEFSIILRKMPHKTIKDDEGVEVTINIDDDDVELVEGREVDVGEYVAEYLSLYMNTYPRLDEVKGKELGFKILSEDEVNDEPEKKNPFAVLKDLKHNT